VEVSEVPQTLQECVVHSIFRISPSPYYDSLWVFKGLSLTTGSSVETEGSVAWTLPWTWSSIPAPLQTTGRDFSQEFM